jgi:hypothetical protein
MSVFVVGKAPFWQGELIVCSKLGTVAASDGVLRLIPVQGTQT